MPQASLDKVGAGQHHRASPADRAWEFVVVLAVLLVGMAVLTGIGFWLCYAVKGMWWAGASAASCVGTIGGWVGIPLACLAILETFGRLKKPG